MSVRRRPVGKNEDANESIMDTFKKAIKPEAEWVDKVRKLATCKVDDKWVI